MIRRILAFLLFPLALYSQGTAVSGVVITTPTALTNNQQGIFRLTPYRAAHIHLVDANGNPVAITNAAPVAGDYGLAVRCITGCGGAVGAQDVNLLQVSGVAITLGQKAMTASIPMVIASDQSAVPVSGTVTANGGTPPTHANRWPVCISDGASACVNQTANRLLVDGSGVTQPVSGTVTSAQGAAAAGTGAWPVVITNTADAVVKPGDAVNNAIRTNCVTGCAGSSFADSTPFTFGTTTVANAGAVVDDTATNTVAENSAGAPRMSTNRVLYGNLRNATGTEVVTTTTTPGGTDLGLVVRNIPSGTQPVSGPIGITNGPAAETQFVCNLRANITASASGSTEIVALSGSTVIYICHISMSLSTGTDIKFVEGTGANCVTGPTDITGLYKNVASMTLPFTRDSPLRSTAARAVCVNLATTATAGGVVIYARF
jgi:hypothetical protein